MLPGPGLECSSCSFLSCPGMCLTSVLSGIRGFSPSDHACSADPSERPHLSICLQSQSGSCFRSMLFTKPGRKGGELFFSPPCVLPESPAVPPALQTEVTDRLRSQGGCQDLVHWLSSWTEGWVVHCAQDGVAPPYSCSVGWTIKRTKSLS